jgi:hypothetical protein
MLKDLSTLESPKEFKDFMEILNKQTESRQDYEIAASSIENDSQNEDSDKGDGKPRYERDILWAFTNADKLKKDFWNRLESRLLDIY